MLLFAPLLAVATARLPFQASLIYSMTGYVSVDHNATTFPGQPAAFGPLPPKSGEQAAELPLVMVPYSACDYIPFSSELNNSIAVVTRGGCSFYTKVHNLQEAGAAAVIVGNIDNSELVKMYSETLPTPILIPSLFVSLASYNALKDYSSAALYSCDNAASALSSLLMFMFSPLLSVTLFYVLISLHRYRERAQLRASVRAVDALPVRVWGTPMAPRREASSSSDPATAQPGTDNNPPGPSSYRPGQFVTGSCAICFDDYDKYSRVLQLPCDHEYHEGCIRRWLLGHKKTCPICNREVQ